MAAGVPPPPLNSPSGSYYWLEWYTNLTNFLNGTNIPWSNLNFSGSNLTDIQTRNHNDLKNIEGGNSNGFGSGHAFHLLGAEFVGSNTVLPTGWSVSLSGSTYTVTHNLGITSYVVMAVAAVAGGTVQFTTTASNSFQVTMTTAVAFNFALLRGS